MRKLEAGTVSDAVDPDVASLVSLAADVLEGPVATRLRDLASRHGVGPD
jgi:hypothetical protein